MPALLVGSTPVPFAYGVEAEVALLNGVARLTREASRFARAVGTSPDAPPLLAASECSIEDDLASWSREPGFNGCLVVTTDTDGRFDVGTPVTGRSAYPSRWWDERFGKPWEKAAESVVTYVTAGRPWVCDVRPALRALRRALGHEEAARVIATVVDALEAVVPAWGPSESFQTVCAYRWMGWEDDSEMRDELRHQLAHGTDRKPEEITDEQIDAEAGDYYWTEAFVRERLPKTMTDAKAYSRDELALRLAHLRRNVGTGAESRQHEEDASALALAEATLVRAERCRAVGDLLTRRYPLRFDDEWVTPYGVVLDTDEVSAGDDLGDSIVVELFEERARAEHDMAGDCPPLAGIAYDPGAPGAAERLGGFLRLVAVAEAAALHLLRTLCPADFEDCSKPTPRRRKADTHHASPIDARYASEDVRAGSQALAGLTRGGGRPLPIPSEAVMLL